MTFLEFKALVEHRYAMDCTMPVADQPGTWFE